MTQSARARAKRAVLFGAGRMGGAMADGWLKDLKAAGLERLDVVEPAPSAAFLDAARGGRVRLNPAPEVEDVLILAVKPQGFASAAAEIALWTGPETLVVSIMAGITIARLADALKSDRVARAMPNTPGAIGRGVTGYCLSPACDAADAETTARLLQPLGAVVGPLREADMNAVTAVSGSGPAYVYLLAEAMAAAGRAPTGLDDATALKLACETVVGAGALLARDGDPTALREAVTSPGGTTAAALAELTSPGGLYDLMRRAVAAAAHRAEELSKQS